MHNKLKFILIIGWLFGCASSWALIRTVTISLEQDIPAPRWMFEHSIPKGEGVVGSMIAARQALMQKNGSACLEALGRATPKAAGIAAWLELQRLRCAMIMDKKGQLKVAPLQASLATIEKNPQWLLRGPHVELLRDTMTQGRILLLEKMPKTNRRQAWQLVDQLLQDKTWLSADSLSQVYRQAGELAFIEQNLSVALEYFMRSLSQKDSEELRSRVDSIRVSLLGKKKTDTIVEPTATSAATPPVLDVGVSDEEKQIFERMNTSFQTQDLMSGTGDALELITKYPGSVRSQQATDRVLEAYLSVAARSEDKFRLLREQTVKQMLRADAGRLQRWASVAFARGYYLDALSFAERAVELFKGHPDSTKTLLLAANAALYSGEYAVASRYYDKLGREHSGTVEAAEGLFRLGLLAFRRKQYGEAAAFFERLLAVKAAQDFEYRGLYWLWRSQQRQDVAKAKDSVERLLQKYPVTYYGLRARAELNGNLLAWDTAKKSPTKIEMRLSESESLAWERCLLLLRAGWFEEAQTELSVLPEPQLPEDKVLRAKLWAVTMKYDRTIQLLNQSWDAGTDWLTLPVLKIGFPKEFNTYISREVKSNGLDINLVRSLIRQESAFQIRAQSSSNAMGLMQLLGPTGAEVAKDLKIKDFQVPDSLFEPATNIRLGSVYLSRLIKSFKGHVPLALAAYNAGPGRMRKWLQARPDLGQVEMQITQQPEDELWIDELPWSETSLYVKAILRNWLIYRMLESGPVKTDVPVWALGGSKALSG